MKKKYIKYMKDNNLNPEKISGYDDAVIGITKDGRLVYSLEKMVYIDFENIETELEDEDLEDEDLEGEKLEEIQDEILYGTVRMLSYMPFEIRPVVIENPIDDIIDLEDSSSEDIVNYLSEWYDADGKFIDGFEHSIIGLSGDAGIVYSYDLMVKELIKRGKNKEEAIEECNMIADSINEKFDEDHAPSILYFS